MTNKTFSASDINTPDQISHIRMRVGMYLSSNTDAGITVAVRELIDNGVDEVLGGHGKEVIVNFYDDTSTEVIDHGRGLPVDKNAKGVNGIILTVGTVGSGGKFSGKDISGGLNGVGASATNATSRRFDVTVYRDSKQYQLSFKEGLPGFFAKENDPASQFSPSKEIKVSKDSRPATERKNHPTGTKIRFWPDYTVFEAGSKPIVEDLKARVKATAFLVNGFIGTVNDYRDPKNPISETYHYDAGLVDMLPTLSHHSFVTKPIHLAKDCNFTQMTNVLQKDGSLKQQEVTRNVNLDVAFGYTNTEDTILNSYVNIIKTHQGGTHEKGLWLALSRVIIGQIKNTRGLLKAKEEPPTTEDVRDGFVGVISVKFPEPTFTGQSKEALATPQITPLVSQSVGEELKSWFENKKNAAQAKIVLQKVVDAKRIREAAKLQKDTARKKTALESAASMPAKLVACSSSDPEVAELWVCEGDSALGGLKQARDSGRVAIYPLRGKPLNVYDTPLSKILANQEWADLIQIIGASSGKSFDLEQVKYQKFVILADGDPDGAHISALVLCGLWKLMPDYVKAGMVYIAMPPLFSITTSGRNKERFYALNEEERVVLEQKLKAAGKKWDKVQRHKGLGEYSSEILDEVVNDPNTRVLRQITVEDVQVFEQSLQLAFSGNANNRKDWITEARGLVVEDDLDF